MLIGSISPFLITVLLSISLSATFSNSYSQSDRIFLLHETSSITLDGTRQKQLIAFAHSLDDAMKITFREDLFKLRLNEVIAPDQLLSSLNDLGIGVFEFVDPSTPRDQLRSSAMPVMIIDTNDKTGP